MSPPRPFPLLFLLATGSAAAQTPVDLVEAFADRANEDLSRSGARWGSGRLRIAIGGGSGRLGDLHVTAGQVVVLNTDGQSFPLPGRVPDILGNADATGAFPTSITVSDGGYEFASIRVDAGGVLRLEGAQAARLYSRGSAVIADGGLVDLSGTTPEAHASRTHMPEASIPRAPSPAGGGDGGFGADRYDNSANFQLLALSNTNPSSDAISNPGADTMGREGQGVGRAVAMGGGQGGVQYPAVMPVDLGAGHGALMDYVFDAIQLSCRSMQVGGVGSGGAYATAGAPGAAGSRIPVAQWAGPLAPTNDNDPPDTPGGDPGPIGLAPPDPMGAGYVRRLLNWELGHLAGGSGGGGGGNHIYWLMAFGGVPPNVQCVGPTASIREWHDHSGAAGGSGGGALQVTSGVDVVVDGVIDASGGNGGSSSYTPSPDDFNRYAMPGGGGSGGALKLQGLRVMLGSGAGRIDVRGGAGGTTVFSGSVGGAGGTGLVRVEDFSLTPFAITASALAPSIEPFDAANDSVGWLSAGPMAYAPSDVRPDSMMASSSCWIRPDGDEYSELVFAGDMGQTPATQGWSLDVFWGPVPQTPAVRRPLRGRTAAFPMSFEEEYGSLLGHDLAPGESAAPLAVRFQGARSGGPLIDPCGPGADDPAFVPGSVTEWVDHPARLNGRTPSVDTFRFVVVFDGTRQPAQGDTPGDVLYGSVRGVTDLRVTVTTQ